MARQLHLVADSADPEARSGRARAPIDIVLADDHQSMRRSLRQVLDREDAMRVVAEAAELSTAVRYVHEQVPHVLVLGRDGSDRSVLETIALLREEVPATEIIVLSMDLNPVFALRALDAGAIGYVLKDHADNELGPAVRDAGAGQEYVSPRLAASVEALRELAGASGLTAREIEVLRLIALGHTSAEIATQLHLSRRTIETHRARLHRKLQTSTRAGLVHYALERRLIGA